jgi:hypothetical protein
MDSNDWHRRADDGKQGQLVKETVGIQKNTDSFYVFISLGDNLRVMDSLVSWARQFRISA